MTIVEYEKRFTELTKYEIFFIMDKEDKCKRFEEGLRMAIRVFNNGKYELIRFLQVGRGRFKY